jgi:hypothetical protein
LPIAARQDLQRLLAQAHPVELDALEIRDRLEKRRRQKLETFTPSMTYEVCSTASHTSYAQRMLRTSSWRTFMGPLHSSTETNVLINPAHPEFAQLVIGDPVPFAFDRSLIDPMR